MGRKRGNWSLSETIAYHLIRGCVRFLQAIPPEASARVGRWVGRMTWPLVLNRRRISLQNLDRVYGNSLSAGRKRDISFRSHVSLFENITVLVTAAGMCDSKLPPIMKIRHREILENEIKNGKGVILVSGHLSNFYLAIGILGRYGVNIGSLVRPLSFRPAEKVVTLLRSEAGVTTFDQGKSALGLTRFLSQGGVAWFSIDQNVRKGVVVESMGHVATTAAGPVKLAMRLNIPIIPVFTRRSGPAEYELTFHSPLRLPAGSPTDGEVKADLQHLTDLLDSRIKNNPEDWLWAHRRWRTGEKLVREGLAG